MKKNTLFDQFQNKIGDYRNRDKIETPKHIYMTAHSPGLVQALE